MLRSAVAHTGRRTDPNGRDWWDITQVYRSWALLNAHWTAFGPLETRTDLPDWLENITLWMNNNWGGDPLRPVFDLI
jgi:hypothetical protein